MALSDDDVNKVAERVLDLGKERSDAAYAEWKAEREEKAKSPEGLAKRISKLEEECITWVDLCLAGYVVLILALIIARPSRGRGD